jgi:hypothetical protein
MTKKSRLYFNEDHRDALIALDNVAGGRGWVNVSPRVVDADLPDIHVNFIGWTNHGITVATFVTEAPRNGEAQTSSLGVLHSRGRLGKDRIREMLQGAPLAIRQDHSQRGILLTVPPATPSAQVLDVMCRFSSELCEHEMTGGWRLELYERD